MEVGMTNRNLKEVVPLVSSRLGDFQGPCMWTRHLGLGNSRIKQWQRQGILMASMALAKSKVLEALTSIVPELSLKVAGLFGIFPGLKFELLEYWKASSMAKNNKSRPIKPSKLSVYLYIPNIIGYTRVLMNCYAFAICFSNKWLFCALYFVSFVCDGIDGWAARKFNQGMIECSGIYLAKWSLTTATIQGYLVHLFCCSVSTFGAVLDMVTDRISTACLLVILSQVYRQGFSIDFTPGMVFLSLLALDIGSHWLQMYSTFLLGKASHKDVKDSTNWLFKAYYGNRMFMAYCCVACEVLYISLFLLAQNETEKKLMDVLKASITEGSLVSVVVVLSLFGWAIKQLVNIIQMKTAADVCVLHDINKKERP
ncbi:hypothetical protein POTOM_033524 [Populus tomentosa]|uniref:CDP-diacylglycerol--inositol 3-phosphatidyltransferase n=1 Tax=Populus tomentosa TaxID=118781 RepID=A0A8X8CHN5_POPTO|nr:hypothetical protein POTOM_033524 [Populus tomentosa]